ncbi:MAG: AAA family ATPase [Deltaproteobacteria bacterium]|nr:AAA family ATPase [Deltaproteobacteria bacterium]
MEPEKPKAHHTVVSLEVTGGFLKGAKFEFADGLNCIIGGRGTGKTTVLEFVRYVLGMMPEEKATPARARAIKALVQSNLGSGRIRLGVQTKHGVGYLAERPWNDSSQVFNEQGEPTAISFDRDLIFKADVYSQNEIEEIATNPSFQLALLDKFIEEDVRRIDADIRKIHRDLGQNAAELLRVDREMRDLRESASETQILEEKLKGLQQTAGPDAKLVNAAHAQKALRERERKTLEALRGDLRRVRSDFDAVVTGLARRLASRVDPDVAAGPNKDVFAIVAQHVQELTVLLERAAGEIDRQTEVTDGVVAEQEQTLAERHAKQDAEYRELVAKSQEETGRATERAQLQQRYAEVSTARKELDLRQTERRQRETQRQELTAQLSGLRDERFRLRKKVADQLSDSLAPTIRVTITQAGNRDGYRVLLTEGLKGQSMKYTAVVERIVQSASPEEFSVLVQREDAARLVERTGLDEDRAKRVVEAFRDSELLYRIETVELDDLPRIELLDGKDYKDSGDLSTGQRCTTILPILLLESERPLLIDQPEDNLDNAFIYETVVKSLKGAKGRRQLIFVTHNPNIPVLGDAERVFVLTSDGKQGKLHKVGTVDELKQEIELLLEGGREAFLLRKKRYGH